MTASPAQRYHARMLRVMRYIDEHLDEDLSIEVLSEVAAFSPFHFHRQFSLLFGVAAHRYVRLLRLKRASYRLAFRETWSITDIAMEGGYASLEAFTRAFKQWVGQNPSEFRQQPDWYSWHAANALQPETRRHAMQTFQIEDVTVVDFPPTRVAVLEHRGDPARLGDSIRQFIAWRKQNQLPPSRSETFTLFHTDPDTVDVEDFRMGLCAATEVDIAPNTQGVVAGKIAGGPCAKLRQTGTSDDLRSAARFLYMQWLPQSGYEPGDFPLFAQRVKFFPDVPEHEAVTDLFLPLKPSIL